MNEMLVTLKSLEKGKSIPVLLMSSVTFRVMEITAGHVREKKLTGLMSTLVLSEAQRHRAWTVSESDNIN